MPVQIEELPKTSRGKTKKYDFAKLYDGKPWLIKQGEDFDCEVASIRQLIYREVAELGKSVRSTETEVGEGDDAVPALAFQVVDEPPRKRGPRKAKENGGEGNAEAEAKNKPEGQKQPAKS